MPIRKIADVPMICRDREHNPPDMMVYEPGVYEHTCPSCGRATRFTVYPNECNGYAGGTAMDARYFRGKTAW